MTKIKQVIGITLGLTLAAGLGFVALKSGNGVFLSRAQNDYRCVEQVRIEPGDNGYEVTHIGSNGGDVVIPAEYNGTPITYISADAFDDCRDTLTSITIDGNITVEDGAFNDMENVIDVTFTGDMTELTYGHIFENTEIGTMTIPGTVTYVSPETFYGVVDTTTLIYDGTFEHFWGTQGSDGIIGSLWTAFKTTLASEHKNGSMPTNIKVAGTNYFIPNGEDYWPSKTTADTCYAYYYKSTPKNAKNKDTKCSFYLKVNTYHKNTANL